MNMIRVTSVFRLKVLDMTGKRRNNVHPNAEKQH